MASLKHVSDYVLDGAKAFGSPQVRRLELDRFDEFIITLAVGSARAALPLGSASGNVRVIALTTDRQVRLYLESTALWDLDPGGTFSIMDAEAVTEDLEIMNVDSQPANVRVFVGRNT